MASDSDCCGSSSSDEETQPMFKKRKYKSMVYSSDSDDANSDVERKPKSRRKPQPLCESDSEVAENCVIPHSASCSSNSGEYVCGDGRICDSGKKTSVESSDSDEQSEKCPICLSKFSGQDIGTPESCDHSFCMECLQEWAKKVNTCPVDRLPFNLILVRRHIEGKIINTIRIENKEFIDEDEEDTDSSFYDTLCEVCGGNDNEERLLLCDDCDLAYHCECLSPPLTSIPRGSWCCPSCSAVRNGDHYLPADLLPDFLEIISTRFRPHSLTLGSRSSPRTYADQVYQRIHQQHGAARTSPVHRVPGEISQHPRRSPVFSRTQRPTRHTSPLTFANSFSSDSSDENVEHTRNTGRRRHCPEYRNRRQNSIQEVKTVIRRIATRFSDFSSSGQQFATFSSFHRNETESSGLLAVESDEDSFEYSYEDGGLAFAQASAVHHRTNHRVKESLSCNPVSGTTEAKVCPASRCPSLPSSTCDILGDILQTQAVLHSPTDFVVIKRDGSLSLKPPSSGHQRPLNPMHHSPVKSGGSHSSTQKSNYVGSSPSSSSVSGSSHYYGVCTMQKPTTADHSSGGGFDSEPYSVMASRSHYNVNLVDDFKKDSFDTSHNKESKTNSDDEVDIYSDIESVGDTETQMDDDNDIDERLKAYKCEESQINNNDDGTDSSENELVIDEDVHAEEENDKLKDEFVEDGICESNQLYTGHNSERREGSEGSVCSDLVELYSDNQENTEGKHNSPGSREEDSRDAFCSIPRHGSSQDGFPLSDTEPRADISEDQEDTQNEPDCGAQNETDSDGSIPGENSLGCEADEENSLDSAKGTSSDAVSEHVSKVVSTIASPSEHSRSAEEEDQAESSFSNDNHFMRHSNDKQMCEEQDSKSGSEAMEADNENGVEESLKHENGDDSMECEDREQDVNDQEMNVDYDPSESLNKDSNENTQSDDESGNQNDADSDDLGDHEESGNSRAQQYSSPVQSILKDDLVSGRDENVSEDFHDEVENNSSDIQEDASEMLIQNAHSVEQKDASESGDVENLENSLQSIYDEVENPNSLQEQCYDNGDMLTHPFEAAHSEQDKVDNEEHFNSENRKDFAEKEINKDKATDHEDNTMDSHNTDLGIEDISDAASDDLNQSECAAEVGISDSKEDCDVISQKQKEMDDVEKNVARLFEQDSNSCGEHKTPAKTTYSKKTMDELGKYHSSSKHSFQSNDEDQEEGEIIEDPPVRKKLEKHDHKLDYGHDDVDDYIDMTPRISISDLPRIPKIKRDRSKNDVPEEIPLELKRTSVLGRVDLGSSDISWKRLSKHTRERSYRDGRPKDERLLYREREGQSKDKKSGNDERRTDEKYRESDRRRDDSKKQESDKGKDKSQQDHSRDRKNEKSKDSYDKSIKSRDWSYSSQEKRERDKQHEKSYKDRHDRERYDRDKDRYERTKDRYDKEKDRYKSEDRYDREKDRDDERFDRDEDRFDRMKHEKEKSREKDRKHKHRDKDRKSEISGKDGSQSKHKRSHSREHFCEKQKEREVRKIDDKLKIVVEHKDPRKEKLEKHAEKKESKHDKKYKDDGHRHHEHRKKDRTSSPYKELAPIESKEIFAKGDSIIINVNFSRSSSKESVLSAEDTNGYTRDNKKSVTSDLIKGDHVSIADDLRTSKLKHTVVEKDRNVVEITGNKRPSTPPERTDGRSSQVLSVGESYWQETDDTDIKSPPEDKCHPEKPCSDDDDDDGARSVDAFGGGDNFSDSDDEPVSENQIPITKADVESESASGPPEQDMIENSFGKENDSYTILRRRSPHPPSPPSPPDNDDSYDPCEPTRSPSLPPSSPPPVPPLSSLEKPKPPPSPELPPLPPEPEPTDVLVREDPRAPKHNAPCPPPEFLGTSSVSSPVSSQPLLYTSNSLVTTVPLPNIRVPPPNFIPHSAGRNVSAVPPQLIPPRTVNWPVSNPPSMIFPSNQVPQVIRGTFVQAAVQSPSTASVVSQMGTMLPPGNTIPIVSQVRHMQMNAHPNLSTNTMMPVSHLNLTQMPVSSLSQPPPGLPNTILNQHSNMTSAQNPPSSFALSVQNQAGCRTVSSQNQLTSIAVSLQNQSQASSPGPNHTGNLPVSGQSQSRLPPPPPTATLSLSVSQKSEKPCKYPSPPNDKTEVVDMDVDSPYSPGDSPSMDSAYDYSPPSSPLAKNESVSKDPFDSLLGPSQKSSSKHSEFGIKVSSDRVTKNKSDHLSGSSKKQKLDHRSEPSKVRHSVRLQFTDKGKSSTFLREKLSDKRDVLKKLDESQLKILDELPSSAVEMQVKEKFLKKLNRQERVIEEVKLALKPYYTRREINKDEYKDVLRKSVPKICHNKTGEINPVKVKSLVEGYVKKVKYLRKKAGKKSKTSKFL